MGICKAALLGMAKCCAVLQQVCVCGGGCTVSALQTRIRRLASLRCVPEVARPVRSGRIGTTPLQLAATHVNDALCVTLALIRLLRGFRRSQ